MECDTDAEYISKVLTRSSSARPKDKRSAHSNAEVLNLFSKDTSNLNQLFFSVQRFIMCNFRLFTGGLYIWSLLGTSGLWGLASLLVTTVPAYYLTKWQLRVYNQQIVMDDLRVKSMQEVVHGIGSIKTAANELFWHKRICDIRSKEYKLKFKATLIGLVSSTL